MNRVRVAVTGIGLVTPLGVGRSVSWQRLLAGEKSVGWLDGAGSGESFGGQVPLEAPETGPSRLNCFAQLAATEAIQQAELNSDLCRKMGCVIGTSKPDLTAIDACFKRLSNPVADDELRQDAFSNIDTLFPSTPSTEVAQRWGMEGPNLSTIAACATGLVSIIRATELIRQGACSQVLAGSADASLHPGLLASYKRLGVLASPNDDPASACRPFDVNRGGFAVGEGAATMVLEEWSSAIDRGGEPIAEWIDGIYGCDPTGLTSVDTSGETLAELIRRLLARNDISPEQVSSICYHGTATEMNDLAESQAIRRLFGGAGEMPLGFGIKGAIGHLMGAAGAVETAVSALALHHQMLPPTANHFQDDPACPVPINTETRFEHRSEFLLKTSLGFGGHLAVGLLKRVDPNEIR